ncbi:MAG: hypothetical protein Q9184_005916, partial [Pyrenodesmia sp. 2 TL-2023]
GVCQIGRGETVTEELGKGTSSGGGVLRVGEVVVDVGFSGRWEEEKPVLLD